MVRKDVGGAGAPLAPTLDPPLPLSAPPNIAAAIAA